MIKHVLCFVLVVGLFLMSSVSAYAADSREEPPDWRDILDYTDSQYTPPAPAAEPVEVSDEQVSQTFSLLENDGIQTFLLSEERVYEVQPVDVVKMSISTSSNSYSNKGSLSITKPAYTSAYEPSSYYNIGTYTEISFPFKAGVEYTFSFRCRFFSSGKVVSGRKVRVYLPSSDTSSKVEQTLGSDGFSTFTIKYTPTVDSSSIVFRCDAVSGAATSGNNVPSVSFYLDKFSISYSAEIALTVEEWLEKIYGVLSGQGLDTPVTDPTIGNNVTAGNEAQDKLDQFDKDLSGQFNSSLGDVQSNVSGFVFPMQALTSMAWITEKWGFAWDSLGDVQSIFYFIMIVGVALLFIGRGPMAMLRVAKHNEKLSSNPNKPQGGGG